MSRATQLLAAAALALTVTGCSGGGPAAAGAVTTAQPSAPGTARDVATGGPFGPACAALPTAGRGTLSGLRNLPVATATTVLPQLSSLARAITAAHLSAALDGQRDITVFAPVDTAFRALPADRLAALLGDVPRLTAVLTHHVLQGRVAPDRLAGSHTTLDNDELVVVRSGDRFTIPGAATLSGKPATVVCGDLQTANATVYLVDQVLAPRAGG